MSPQSASVYIPGQGGTGTSASRWLADPDFPGFYSRMAIDTGGSLPRFAAYRSIR